jgi:hypothetical protein
VFPLCIALLLFMDIFGTTVTALGLAIQVLDAYQAFPGDKQELLASFRYDLLAVQKLKEHFEVHRPEGEDEEPLTSTIIFLDGFDSMVEETIRKLQRTGLRNFRNRILYVRQQTYLASMKENLFRWSLRLHLLPQLKAITTAPPDIPAPPAVRSNYRLQQFTAWARSAQEARGRDLEGRDLGDLQCIIDEELREGGEDGIMEPVTYEGRQLILSSRRVSRSFLPGTENYERLASQMRILAAALNCLDPTADIRLLRVESFFYHTSTNQFIFTQTPPCPVKSMRTLETVVRRRPGLRGRIGLGKRLRLAAKLTEAVFFLHAAGFVHKNITSGSVVLLERSDEADPDADPDTADAGDSLEQGFLMGFDLIRGKDARTTQEGVYSQPDREQETSIWDFSIFQHPHRHLKEDSPRYIKAFDVYSLGVLLLEIGMWEPLERLVGHLDDTDSSTWPQTLLEAAQGLAPRTGERYQRVVTWCLGLDGREDVGEMDFSTEILDHLDELSRAVL